MQDSFSGIWEKEYEEDKTGYRYENYWHKITVSFDLNGNSKWVAVHLFDVKLANGTTQVEEFKRETWKGDLKITGGKARVDYMLEKIKGEVVKRSYFIEYINDTKIVFIGKNGHKLIFRKQFN